MDKTLKRYINDLALTLLIGECPEDNYRFINFNKLCLRMLGAIKNYANFRLKLLQNPKIIEVEHTVLKRAFKVAIETGCKKYDIRIPTEVQDKLVDEFFIALIVFIYKKRSDIFIDALNYCDSQIKGKFNESQ